ncbi:OprD family porin [Pseudomonas oryzihabitans]|uniref:OprD family porin n=1 Tax=Pseudomonas oryzihabitans TaxID=47885 RepID=UPI00111E99B5|nr:OprD family porin [Pseudomonas psychrotolerans]QDD91289.1 outer membrane porin, OprD family [Pseudomonas psychrotolerans]
MHKFNSYRAVATLSALTAAALGTPSWAFADFLADSKASLEARNLYFNRDFRQPGGSSASGQSKAEEWGQGFILRSESGYTEGSIGVGVDAIGMFGMKLDSSHDRAGTALFPTGSDGNSQDNYSKLGVTAKAKASNTTLKVGALIFRNQMLLSPDGRLLPQMFRGAMIESNEIQGLSLQAARIKDAMPAQSGHWDKMSANRIGGQGDAYSFYGGDYALDKQSTLGLHYGELEDVFQQVVVNASRTFMLGDASSLKADVRYAQSQEDGNFRDIDNKAFGAMLTYRLGAQAFGLGYQKMRGDDPYPYVANSDPYLVNFIQISDFANVNERSWQARYDLDFATLGVPGLSFMTRYVSGDQVQLAAGGTGKEWERNTDITYAFQSGPLKNLSLRWRNATVRSSFGNDLDENRLIVQYMIPLL